MKLGDKIALAMHVEKKKQLTHLPDVGNSYKNIKSFCSQLNFVLFCHCYSHYGKYVENCALPEAVWDVSVVQWLLKSKLNTSE